MEDCSASGKRPSYSIRVTPSKPDAKRERRVDSESEQRGTRVKKPLLFGLKPPPKIPSPKLKVSFLFLCLFVLVSSWDGHCQLTNCLCFCRSTDGVVRLVSSHL